MQHKATAGASAGLFSSISAQETLTWPRAAQETAPRSRKGDLSGVQSIVGV